MVNGLMIKKCKISLLIALALLLCGCDMALFQPKGMVAAEEIKLIILATLLMLIVVIPVIIMTLAIAWRYRASNTRATYKPDWCHNVKLEIVWWAVPCVIILILAIVTWITSHTLDPYRKLDAEASVKPVTIQAVSLNWKWLFIYPEQHIATINYVQAPVNTPINFEITSEGPMNSLWIPQLGGQIYAMAGMRTQLHLIADTLGIYDGLSANYSGAGFTNMMFKTKISSQSDFDAWVSEVKQSPMILDMKQYNMLIEPSDDEPVQYFSATQDDLFKKIMMRFMMPQDTSTIEKGSK
jgi:cytochrome o ubiquinol oxidase subunit II